LSSSSPHQFTATITTNKETKNEKADQKKLQDRTQQRCKPKPAIPAAYERVPRLSRGFVGGDDGSHVRKGGHLMKINQDASRGADRVMPEHRTRKQHLQVLAWKKKNESVAAAMAHWIQYCPRISKSVFLSC
jgi:hypothetical protein